MYEARKKIRIRRAVIMALTRKKSQGKKRLPKAVLSGARRVMDIILRRLVEERLIN